MARPSAAPTPPMRDWETTTLEAVGRVIEFWGFKRNHGRMWALLFLTDEAMSAAALGRRLGLSKGGVSIVLRELQSWAVVRRVPAASRSGVAYAAEQDFWVMIRAVIQQREHRLVDQVRQDLAQAEAQAARDTTLPPARRRQVARRIRIMRRFADAAGLALDGFLKSKRLNLNPLRKILMGLGKGAQR